MEHWRSIPGYEDIYEASNDGRIRTAEGKTTYTEIHGARHWKQRELSQGWHASGYMVTLWKNGQPRKCLVARLIATAFLEDLLDSNMTVNHIDGNRKNNHIKNLEWLTLGDNIKHGFKTGLYGRNQKSVILDDLICFLNFESMAAASRHIGRTSGYLSNAVKRRTRVKGSDGTEYKVYL